MEHEVDLLNVATAAAVALWSVRTADRNDDQRFDSRQT